MYQKLTEFKGWSVFRIMNISRFPEAGNDVVFDVFGFRLAFDQFSLLTESHIIIVCISTTASIKLI